MPTLSVIIPTRDRADPLRDCLATLQAQQLAPGAVEAVIVDDGSTCDLSGLATATHGPVDLRCVRQAPQGLNAARNRGIEETTGALVAFLDDDTLLAPSWAAAVIAAFATHGCDGLGGRVRLRFEQPPPAWLRRPQRRYLAEFDLGDHPRWLDDGPVPVGANCAVRRGAVRRIGGFRSGLDREGTSLISNGDTEFFRRLRATGGRLRYEPAAEVIHCVGPERVTRAFFKRRAFAQGVSDVRLAAASEPAPRPLALARELWRCGRAVPVLAQGVATGRGSMNAVQWVNYCRGRLDATRAGR